MSCYREYEVDRGVFIWGGSERAAKLAEAIASKQPVIWAWKKAVPPRVSDGVRNQAIRTLWGRDLAYLKGKVGRFTVGLRDADETVEVRTGAVVLVPEPSRPMLEFPDAGEVRGCSVAVILMGVSRGTYSAALPKVCSLVCDNRVWVITDDIQTSFEGGEALYSQARRQGAVFIRTDKVPSVVSVTGTTGEKFEAVVQDRDLGREICLRVDKVVAPVWGLGDDMSAYFDRLGLRDFDWGGYPGDTNREGIYVFPDPEGFMTEEEENTVVQAIAAKTAVLVRGRLQAARKFEIDGDRCAYCLTCYRNCPHMAVEMRRDEGYRNLYGEACFIDDLSCRGCGVCYSLCPAQAIRRVSGKEDLCAETHPTIPMILACQNAAGMLLRQGGIKADYRLFPCAGAIGDNDILRVMAANGGKRDVYVVSCYQDKCEHQHKDRELEGRVKRLNRLLAAIGIEGRVRLMRMSAADRLSRFTLMGERS